MTIPSTSREGDSETKTSRFMGLFSMSLRWWKYQIQFSFGFSLLQFVRLMIFSLTLFPEIVNEILIKLWRSLAKFLFATLVIQQGKTLFDVNERKNTCLVTTATKHSNNVNHYTRNFHFNLSSSHNLLRNFSSSPTTPLTSPQPSSAVTKAVFLVKRMENHKRFFKYLDTH